MSALRKLFAGLSGRRRRLKRRVTTNVERGKKTRCNATTQASSQHMHSAKLKPPAGQLLATAVDITTARKKSIYNARTRAPRRARNSSRGDDHDDTAAWEQPAQHGSLLGGDDQPDKPVEREEKEGNSKPDHDTQCRQSR